ncbi:hypothetical protein J4E85_002789 [Alternaria conjuncta]|uniref:uncharacterized protein n=1 Tax=Alternaria conjuncta TaxID=181017 RepID=UPI00221ECECC|nr:uncharacterized protein J4E85_002789 [Alternaria conjuncta]KAI4934927.1 hypothetical protein J4E85_002789 [Alternaria conjuncta]
MKGGLRHRLRRWYREKRTTFSSSSKTTSSSEMHSASPNDAPRCEPADPTLANSATLLLRLPGELRNRIYEYALQTDNDLQFTFHGIKHSCFVGLGAWDCYEDLNQLKLTCRQLYKETAGLEAQVNRVHFVSHWSHRDLGPGEQFLTFIQHSAANKRGQFRNITLWVDQFPYQQSLERRGILLELAEYCRQHPHVNIRYVVSDLDKVGFWIDVVSRGLYLSSVICREDRRSVATMACNRVLDDMEGEDWLEDADAVAAFRVSNLQFWLTTMDFTGSESFQRELETVPWLDADVFLEVAGRLIDEVS